MARQCRAASWVWSERRRCRVWHSRTLASLWELAGLQGRKPPGAELGSERRFLGPGLPCWSCGPSCGPPASAPSPGHRERRSCLRGLVRPPCTQVESSGFPGAPGCIPEQGCPASSELALALGPNAAFSIRDLAPRLPAQKRERFSPCLTVTLLTILKYTYYKTCHFNHHAYVWGTSGTFTTLHHHLHCF